MSTYTRFTHLTFPLRPSIFLPFHTLCSCSAKLALRWCDEFHDVRLRLLLWEFKQSPTREITVTNCDRPNSFLPQTLSFSSVSLSRFSYFRNMYSLQRWFIGMTDNNGMLPKQVLLMLCLYFPLSNALWELSFSLWLNLPFKLWGWTAAPKCTNKLN